MANASLRPPLQEGCRGCGLSGNCGSRGVGKQSFGCWQVVAMCLLRSVESGTASLRQEGDTGLWGRALGPGALGEDIRVRELHHQGEMMQDRDLGGPWNCH